MRSRRRRSHSQGDLCREFCPWRVVGPSCALCRLYRLCLGLGRDHAQESGNFCRAWENGSLCRAEASANSYGARENETSTVSDACCCAVCRAQANATASGELSAADSDVPCCDWRSRCPSFATVGRRVSVGRLRVALASENESERDLATREPCEWRRCPSV